MSPRGLAVALAGSLIAAAVAAGCAVTGTVYQQQDFQHTFTVGLAPEVVIDTFNGRISVTAGGDGTVEAHVTSRGSGTSDEEAAADLRNVQVTFDPRSDAVTNKVTITARRTDDPVSLGNSGADIEISVPAESSVELRTSNGRIEVANVMGSILAFTSNGAITTRGGTGLDLDTSNGALSVNNATGRLSLRTSNGPLDIVAYDPGEPPPADATTSASVSAQTSNAGLTFSGSLAPGSHTFETTNGDLTLTLPGDAAFSIDGRTSNGSVLTEFAELEVTDSALKGRTSLAARTSIRADTINGDLAVMKQRP